MDSGISFTQLEKLLNLLEELHSNGHQYLNLNKVSTILGLSQEAADNLICLIFKFQDLFTAPQFTNHLVKIRKSGNWYLTTSKDHENSTSIEVWLTKIECNLLSDISHYFQHIAKGAGFDLRFVTTELLKNVKKLKKAHPYFFETRGNGLMYPTFLALSLGNRLDSYNRTNRFVSCLMCENYKIIIT